MMTCHYIIRHDDHSKWCQHQGWGRSIWRGGRRNTGTNSERQSTDFALFCLVLSVLNEPVRISLSLPSRSTSLSSLLWFLCNCHKIDTYSVSSLPSWSPWSPSSLMWSSSDWEWPSTRSSPSLCSTQSSWSSLRSGILSNHIVRVKYLDKLNPCVVCLWSNSKIIHIQRERETKWKGDLYILQICTFVKYFKYVLSQNTSNMYFRKILQIHTFVKYFEMPTGCVVKFAFLAPSPSLLKTLWRRKVTGPLCLSSASWLSGISYWPSIIIIIITVHRSPSWPGTWCWPTSTTSSLASSRSKCFSRFLISESFFTPAPIAGWLLPTLPFHHDIAIVENILYVSSLSRDFWNIMDAIVVCCALLAWMFA